MKLERTTFGPVLRAARERKCVTLRQLSMETKLSVELWEGLEESDLSRWPKRIFARSYVRDYAVRVGLDPDEVVNEFCRLFPEWGDRRAERLLREQAEIVDHDLHWEDAPAPQRRRASDRVVSAGWLNGHRPLRIAAAALDTGLVLGTAAIANALDWPFWPAAALVGLAYTIGGTVLVGRSLGLVLADWAAGFMRPLPLHRRLPSSKTQRA